MIKKQVLLIYCCLMPIVLMGQERSRIRSFGIETGILMPGTWNAITDVEGVEVGHRTLVMGDSIRTGVTVILPHGGNIFQEKVPAAVSVGNGFGKALGFTQVQELGNLETPIALSSTLSVFTVADALVDHISSLEGNEGIRSVNPVAGECNDGWLNDIRGRHVKKVHVLEAIAKAESGPLEEGNVGAGTGTLCLGFKGGIGSSSRVLPPAKGGYTVGVLVQTNFGGILAINGAPVGKELENHYMAGLNSQKVDGSCMIVIATDAPLSARNLERLADRAFLALGRVGSFMSNGSGDYAIAFSTHPQCRIKYKSEQAIQDIPQLGNDFMSPLFLAVVEATEEAIYNSIFMAEDMMGQKGRFIPALPIEKTLKIMDQYNQFEKTNTQ